eukprot:TRINITY_DN13358_c0_g1_i2.p1 TRINITY_DN13358_c0_g1~~TRINITY_DN13358_c0_g1_i2.p1  ORF type:complete len:298 (-),score=44.57 TRINITY_DN13358_c0_g1_i2:103-996(-)
MQCWLWSTVAVAVGTLVVFFCLSFDSLEYQEIGLNYSWINEIVEQTPYKNGRYYLGLGNHFIKFPRTVKSVFFVDDVSEGVQGPALISRAKDGLNVHLEVSFQYKLIFDKLYDLYATLGTKYEDTFVRMAMEQLATASTEHNAHFFFTNRTAVSNEMHGRLNGHFKKHAFAEVPFFQLRTVHLPTAFEDSIRQTQVKQQDIQIARLEQQTRKITYKTTVLKAEQAVKALTNQAAAEARSIELNNDAYCKQYTLTQQLQSDALSKVGKASGWTGEELLEYVRIRAVRDHPSNGTVISI